MARLTPDWTPAERKILKSLTTPAKIQGFLDSVGYSADPIYRSPRSVMRDRRAHCFDGALFAACALGWIGFRPRLLDMRAVRDDDHILAVYELEGRYGALAKSNFVGLRFREPIFKTLRELVLSYFEDYYNASGEKTLRAFSKLLDLRRFDRLQWQTSDQHLDLIAKALDEIEHQDLLTKSMIRRLTPKDDRSLRAGMLGVNLAGLYKPNKKRD